MTKDEKLHFIIKDGFYSKQNVIQFYSIRWIWLDSELYKEKGNSLHSWMTSFEFLKGKKHVINKND